MNRPPELRAAADARHWRRSRSAALGLALAWRVLAFGPLLFARQLSAEVGGAPLVVWMGAQGAPIGFLLLVWRHERVPDRLDRERREGRVQP